MIPSIAVTLALSLGSSPASEGRLVFNDPGLGKNGVACADCHATVKNEAKRGDGHIRAGHTLAGVAKRPFWRGDRERRFYRNLGDAVGVCVQVFQGGDELGQEDLRALTAYLKRLSKKRRQPALRIETALEADLDYNRPKYRNGDPTAGRALFYRACHSCHPHGRSGVAPSIVGLDVPDIAKAVREGNGLLRGARKGSAWMPAFGKDRLSNAQVADIAAYVSRLPKAP